ncbi:purine and uridine phosphorylase [Mytilinidion resinicola]|uniref:Purine and uridine phosphorylase n=1 Tax=Mytilinidion resinicola TaxID=574789 RepID=A0A6A6YEU6_9PEZI|nr:purine and uridine phosphorylase [Mytilinidion resinicola]KAF2807352.1 purine and uridine phosphorylase [Mytilinidion resinicola]
MSSTKDYTVGWICAIATEYVAAQAFLDAKHERPEYLPPHDNNDYTLGEIGKHYVVVAVLPEGEYGISSAASVARDMLHSFPNVRIGLMVGIGGGAPSPEHDIRLGDIVVSAPRDGKGGVLQYDYGKTIQNQSFQCTGFLNQPPTLLRTAVTGIKAQYESDGHTLEEAIESVLEKKPRLRKKYQRPGSSSDRLYQAGVTHSTNDEANCALACSDNTSDLILRHERAENEDNPAIYYGLIASANQLMKDALLRDKFAKENDVLCFEMEAAGLMNHFPCLVIRGICDYSDTHKNKEWQGYAAMAAAAYAKDLLVRIPVNKLEAQRRISDVLSSIERNVYEAHRDVKDLALEQRRAELHRWLSPPEPSTNYNKALQRRQEGTGSWFSQSNAFATWKSQRNSFLWLYGIPGCGKTILSSTIIEHLKSLSIQSLLYFYFDFTDTEKQSLRGVVCSLISQLYHTCKSAQEPLDALFSSFRDRNTQPSCESLCKVLQKMIKRTEEVWVVLDAIDECLECKGSPTEGLLLWIRDLVRLQHKNVHCLVISRPEQDIQLELSRLVNKKDRISIQSDLVNDDILAYINAKVREGEGLKRWRGCQDIQKEIKEGLAQKADGMFRWVACQIDALEDCLDYPTLRTALNSLPKTLDETYKRIIVAIPDNYKENALRIL